MLKKKAMENKKGNVSYMAPPTRSIDDRQAE